MHVQLANIAAGVGPWVLGLLGLVGAVAVGRAIYRGGTSQALGYLRESNQVLLDKVGDVEADRDKYIVELRLLHEQLALLETRTSLEPMVAAVINQFEAHEDRARERQIAVLAVLHLIGDRLGPDPNGGD